MQVFLLTTVAMIAFAGNSLLCRLALQDKHIDATTFASVRIVSGGLALWLMVRLGTRSRPISGSWRSALALLAYVAAFSFAYITLSAGAGALLLFGAVQATMILHGLRSGERLGLRQGLGLAVSVAGLLGLAMPGISAPPIFASMTMVLAGVAWGIYSLRGKGSRNPLEDTAGNFLRAAPVALFAMTACFPWAQFDATGLGLAVASGAVTSGIGYAIWYAALRTLKSTTAAVVQLSVPVLATAGGAALLGESVTLRLAASSIAILGGIALVIVPRNKT
jgi:drug/metabolite transporter (DMT)-like permease